jgi:ABC-type nitrate/sulfonate/bicarbonate transport system ATPase subunit
VARREDGLVFDRISHTYVAANGRTPVLEDVTLTVLPGRVACVVGPSGCGKSTLLSLAAGLMRPTSGIVRWKGNPSKNVPIRISAWPSSSPASFPG